MSSDAASENTPGFGTRAIHAGQPPEPTTGAVMPPIFYTSTYAQASPGVHRGFEYSRTQNPTRFALEANLASLERAEWGLAFASGCAAATAILHLLAPGDHIVAVDDIYGGTYRLFERVFGRLGMSTSYVDPTLGAGVFAEALRPSTRLIWIETPTNPTLKLCDIRTVASAVRAHESVAVGNAGSGDGILVVVDNTFLSPYFQAPLELGADLVVHSTTKYLGGHSDVVGGAVVGCDLELKERLSFLQNAIGAVPSPMDCFLTLRGIKTLHVRMQRHAENAATIARWLSQRAEVSKVIYPGLASHPQHALAGRQQRGHGGMLSFEVKGGLDAARRVLERCRLFTCAESLGGVESLIEHPASMTHASIPLAQRQRAGISDGLIRVSVGIEDVSDQIADLEQAMGRAQ